MDKIGGAVQGVYYPVENLAFFVGSPLFGDKTCRGQYPRQAVNQHLLGGFVNIGNIIVHTFGFHIRSSNFSFFTHNEIAGLFCQLYHPESQLVQYFHNAIRFVSKFNAKVGDKAI